jgi:DNA-binding NarL/FixJ family response regulator
MFESLPRNRSENPLPMTNVNPFVALVPASALDHTPESEPLVLTTAERTIALLVAEGARNHDIARQLGVSHRTVESHLSNIFAKLGIGSRVQLALWISSSSQNEG